MIETSEQQWKKKLQKYTNEEVDKLESSLEITLPGDGTSGFVGFNFTELVPLKEVTIVNSEKTEVQAYLNQLKEFILKNCSNRYSNFVTNIKMGEIKLKTKDGKEGKINAIREIKINCSAIGYNSYTYRPIDSNILTYKTSDNPTSFYSLSKLFTETNPIPRKFQGNKKIVNAIIKGQIFMGMPEEAMLVSWGKPESVNESVFSFGVHKQYVYGTTYVYVENGFIRSWQSSR